MKICLIFVLYNIYSLVLGRYYNVFRVYNICIHFLNFILYKDELEIDALIHNVHYEKQGI